MIDCRPLAVVWQPGCFGHFLIAILELQKNNFKYDVGNASTHDTIINTLPFTSINVKKIHGRIPTEEETKIYKSIFPYFPNAYRFLPNIFHYVKFFKEFPTKENFKKFDIKDFFYQCLNKKEFFYKTMVTHIWLHKINVPKNVYALDMTGLFLDTNKFKLNLEIIIQEKLLGRTEEFIEKKKELNLPFFKKYVDFIFKIKESVLQIKEQELTSHEDYFKCLLLAEIIDYKQELYDKFLNNYKGQELTTTNDIRKIFI